MSGWPEPARCVASITVPHMPSRAGTALVTGATSGIGAAFARRLAREGYDLVIVARDEARLLGIARDLRDAERVEVEVLAADLTDDDARGAVEQRLADPERAVDVLINNAGIPIAKGFQVSSVEAEERLLRLNVLAVLRLAKAAMPGMVERGFGGIVNVSSIAGFFPYGTYSASKAWVTRFSESLSVELAGTGVRVVALCPGFTRTEFHARAGITRDEAPGWSWLAADDVVDAAWRGLRAGRTVVVPDMRYQALIAATRHLPMGAITTAVRATGRRRRRPTE